MKHNLSAAGLLVAALALGATSCSSQRTHYDDHWNNRSVGLRMGNYAYNYREDRDGEFWAYQGRQMSSVGLTLQRHFLNENPDNPLQPH
jgi:hypothetical protein